MNRRDFLLVTAAAALARSAAVALDESTGVALGRPALLPALGADGVRAIGRRHRARVPAAADRRALRDGVRALGTRATVADLVAADFAAGRTVVVDGWVLAASEARQCALLADAPV
jgi:hypothetical protein